ncbi:hypothetical protein [Silanimonas lenta]|uniref:hypothetical protein n=1 Tax=Silanimonas lenta TaxID=265429 RepID=UPI000424D29E|nr:hypothetical protein [Silanimonas lenta]
MTTRPDSASSDLALLLFALALCAAFGALFAWALAVPFWLGFAMVGSALFVAGLRGHGEAGPRRRGTARRLQPRH